MSNGTKQNEAVIVIGAGIVGISCAAHLIRRGVRVLVLDRGGVGEACSRGNAGILESSSVIPLASPGLLRRLPGLLLDKAAPVVIRPRYLVSLMPWLWRFLRQSTRGLCWENAQALSALLGRSVAAYEPLLDWAQAGELIRHTGWLVAYESQRLFDNTAWEREYRARFGVRFEHWCADRMHEEVPALGESLKNAVYYPDSAFCLDPHALVKKLASAFLAAGGEVAVGDVVKLDPCRGGITVITRDSEFHADRLIIAAGAWSGKLTRMLGDVVPLNTERGYHSMLPRAEISLPMPVMFDDAKFVATPMRKGLRLAGTSELASVDAPADYSRADQLVEKARDYLPGLHCEGTSVWMGFRPSLPDSLPVIGISPRQPRVVYAFGHQHLGLTLGAITGRLVTQLHLRDTPDIDLTPYRVSRF